MGSDDADAADDEAKNIKGRRGRRRTAMFRGGESIEILDPWMAFPLFVLPAAAAAAAAGGGGGGSGGSEDDEDDVDVDDEIETWRRDLPRFDGCGGETLARGRCRLPEKVRSFLLAARRRANKKSNLPTTYLDGVVSFCLQLAFSPAGGDDDDDDEGRGPTSSAAKAMDEIVSSFVGDDDHDNDVDDDDVEDDDRVRAAARSTWKLVEENATTAKWTDLLSSVRRWERLVRFVHRSMHVVLMEHPLHKYASRRVPELTAEERSEAARLLGLLPHSPAGAAAPSALALMRRIQDAHPPRPYGVVLRSPPTPKSTRRCWNPSSRRRRRCGCDPYPHSCVPTAQLEWLVRDPSDGERGGDRGEPRISVTALYDVEVAEDDEGGDDDEGDGGIDGGSATICCIDVVSGGFEASSVEDREEAVLRRTGSSCGCVRCRYEASGTASGLPVADLIRLARYYMSNGPALDRARELYERVLELQPDHLDARHALGAIELSRGRFLAAQRLWKRAAAEVRGEGAARCVHDGIALQLAKIDGYGYLRKSNGPEDEESAAASLPHLSSRSPFPNAHVATLLTRTECRRIVEWANTGTWTKQRHYAVPTHDVPVHTVAPLLDWFNSFMADRARPALARQFGTSRNFYVHDAFVVRYRATSASNHLPLHVDESTHSMVLALNDCDEDYEGGGTYFLDRDEVLRLKVGEVMSFRGDLLRHGGEAVTKGTRYIMAVFMYHDDDDQSNIADRMSTIDTAVSAKRKMGDVNQILRASKEQKINFSFGFQVDS